MLRKDLKPHLFTTSEPLIGERDRFSDCGVTVKQAHQVYFRDGEFLGTDIPEDFCAKCKNMRKRGRYQYGIVDGQLYKQNEGLYI